MEEEDDWNPDMTGESILKAKVIHFSNEIVDRNLEQYNSKPTPYQYIGDSDQSDPDDHKKDESQVPQNQENLYDPLDDEHEQLWVSKALQKQVGYKRPLSCPGCFTPLCYSYSQGKKQNQFVSEKVFNCNYNPYPRSSNLQFLCNFGPQYIQKVSDTELSSIGETINSQQKSIDLKFQLQCNQCQNVVGVYDTQQNNYQLTNLI